MSLRESNSVEIVIQGSNTPFWLISRSNTDFLRHFRHLFSFRILHAFGRWFIREARPFSLLSFHLSRGYAADHAYFLQLSIWNIFPILFYFKYNGWLLLASYELPFNTFLECAFLISHFFPLQSPRRTQDGTHNIDSNYFYDSTYGATLDFSFWYSMNPPEKTASWKFPLQA